MITNITGGHLTATNKAAINTILSAGSWSGRSSRIDYTITPLGDGPNRYQVTISKMERDWCIGSPLKQQTKKAKFEWRPNGK